MTVLHIENMHCEKCAERIGNALKAAGIDFSVSLADKTVTVNDADAARAADELEDIGFSLDK